MDEINDLLRQLAERDAKLAKLRADVDITESLVDAWQREWMPLISALQAVPGAESCATASEVAAFVQWLVAPHAEVATLRAEVATLRAELADANERAQSERRAFEAEDQRSEEMRQDVLRLESDVDALRAELAKRDTVPAMSARDVRDLAALKALREHPEFDTAVDVLADEHARNARALRLMPPMSDAKNIRNVTHALRLHAERDACALAIAARDACALAIAALKDKP